MVADAGSSGKVFDNMVLQAFLHMADMVSAVFLPDFTAFPFFAALPVAIRPQLPVGARLATHPGNANFDVKSPG